MVLSESQSSTRSRSESEEYEDMDVSGSDNHECSKCSCTKNKMSNSPRRNYYETMQFLLNQFAREAHLPEPEETDDQEPASHYYRGGYHVLRLGETLNQKYLVYRKLGWDELSTKWLARDCENNRYVTVTVFKGSEMHTEYATNLIRTFNKIQEHPSDRILKLLDHFQITGVNGTHVCIVTALIAECLNNYMIRRNFKPTPLKRCKAIAKQILEGLHHLHTVSKLVHTTLKPDSIYIKADNAFTMYLVYNTYLAYNKAALPVSFVCNLPSRLVHFKTKIADLSPELLLEDKEFEAYKQRMRRYDSIVQPSAVVETSFAELGEGNQLQDIDNNMPPLNVVHVNTNTLMGRLSRFIKCKMNINQSTQKHDKKYASSTKSRSTKSSCSKSSNTTDYESTSIKSFTSMNTAVKCTSKESGQNNKIVENTEKKENLDRKSEQSESLVEKLENLEIDQTSFNIPTTSSFNHRNNDKREISPDESDIESQMKAMQVYLAETLIDQWYNYNNGQLEELGEKCKTIQSQIQEECCSGLEKERNSLNLETRKEEIEIGEIEYEPTLELLKKSSGEKMENGDDQHSNSDFLDDLSTSSESSKNEDAESEKHSPSENKKKGSCGCHKCVRKSPSTEEKEEESSQRDSSYSTSTSTQQSYTEFLLNFCKHNTLCLEFTKYMEDTKHQCDKDDDSSEQHIEIVIADLENVRVENDTTLCKDEIQRQYKAIELIYTDQFDSKIDIWSVACIIFELVTGDYMFNPTESKYYTIDEHHILKAIQLLAEMPPGLMEKERHIRNIKLVLERDCANMIRLNARENFYRALTKSYRIQRTEAKQLTRLLVPMLRLNPANRSTAEQCLTSGWFSNR